MSVLAEFDNFQCFLVGPEDKTQLKLFIGPAFALEPLNSHLGQDGQLASVRFINFVVDKYSENGYCVAIRDTSSGLIVAALIVLDYMDAHSSDLQEHLIAECGILSPIFQLIDKLHCQYFSTQSSPTQRGQFLEVMATAVDQRYYNKGLMGIMCHNALLNIRRKHKCGIPILMEPTGAFSQAAGIRIGGIKVDEILYAQFEVNGTKLFERVPKPHDRIALITLS